MKSLEGIEFSEIAARGFHEGNERGIDHRHEDLFFVLEVEIDSAIGDVSPGRNIRDVSREVAVAGEDSDGSLQNAIAFFTAAGGFINRMPSDVAAALASR